MSRGQGQTAGIEDVRIHDLRHNFTNGGLLGGGDSILDHLVHHAYSFKLSGDSLRKLRGHLAAGQDSA